MSILKYTPEQCARIALEEQIRQLAEVNQCLSFADPAECEQIIWNASHIESLARALKSQSKTEFKPIRRKHLTLVWSQK